MAIKYNQLNLENLELIAAKAKVKDNGVYTLRGIIYRVKDKVVTHYASAGEICEVCYGFLALVGNYDTRDEAIRKMKGI
ncbi:hypothetical protein UFOVP67_55 [uncultured Caudovirales phage]|uniref:Uncharacterized protein n=1 Tax=uncultured Caudovirales phage TaxID=2100421 RepID=A0A6J5TAW6_9CAUD|nr:hypothetical protein UFOVP67_55 [uncultured Caudovirales phage]